ncbi:hypothetical protein [Streptomyces scabiei]|uniref:hypothetical protein n=1 Tax=Streptomyces scabiei TaxID=1930 RepID=UPI0029AA6F37|nr:hypothetical protein [Streptomyces scabiei]MDX3122744.1 hypothetical protein [Streptomyces scabiei]MDX3199343.1 hypothetical protein [Streptomyces scabiei]MDX3223217.1 hypothetical protein [Streptomyces scabiei]
MPIEYVPEFDEAGNHIGGYTERVPDLPVKEEPDCYSCNGSGCPQCAPAATVAEAQSFPLPDAWAESWGGGYSSEPPFPVGGHAPSDDSFPIFEFPPT